MIIQFFNKDASFAFQGTAAVVLAGLVASLKVIGGTLADHTFLFLGAGEVNPTFGVNHANEAEMNYFTPIENNCDLIFQACVQISKTGTNVYYQQNLFYEILLSSSMIL